MQFYARKVKISISEGKGWGPTLLGFVRPKVGTKKIGPLPWFGSQRVIKKRPYFVMQSRLQNCSLQNSYFVFCKVMEEVLCINHYSHPGLSDSLKTLCFYAIMPSNTGRYCKIIMLTGSLRNLGLFLLY